MRRGSAAPTRTLMACCASTYPRALTCRCSRKPNSTRSRPGSTAQDAWLCDTRRGVLRAGGHGRQRRHGTKCGGCSLGNLNPPPLFGPVMLRVESARWGQTPADLRELAMSASHPRTRERFLALYEITQESCATRIAERTCRHPQTVMEWLHLYNTGGPEALTYQRTGGRPPLSP